MKAYVHKCNSISVLNSFELGILNEITNFPSKKLIEPNYKEIIPSSNLRRMSKVIRMGVGSALKAVNGKNVEGIIVGSGIGCYNNSITFTKEYLERGEGSLSPTAFIQSTDNTIAGQIALLLKNNFYNITYIHKGLAFENALIDAILKSIEVQNNVLVGGVDEWIQSFELGIETKNLYPNYWLGEGASFFVINQQEKESLAKIVMCSVVSTSENTLMEKINYLLNQNELEKPNLILYGNSFINSRPISENIFGIKTYNYSNLCGIYYTNSSFATHLAVEIIASPDIAKSKGFDADKILIINNFYDSDFGIIYLSRT